MILSESVSDNKEAKLDSWYVDIHWNYTLELYICFYVNMFGNLTYLVLKKFKPIQPDMNYATEDLQNIRKLARTSYDKFHLGTATQTWIIVLGIKRQPMQYRGSRAGRKLFGRILSWITGIREQSKHWLDGGVVLTHLLKLQADTTKHYNCKLAHINARSITNKSSPIQHYLHDQELIFVQSQKHGLKPMSKLPQKKFYHQAIISSPNLDQMEDAVED